MSTAQQATERRLGMLSAVYRMEHGAEDFIRNLPLALEEGLDKLIDERELLQTYHEQVDHFCIIHGIHHGECAYLLRIIDYGEMIVSRMIGFGELLPEDIPGITAEVSNQVQSYLNERSNARITAWRDNVDEQTSNPSETSIEVIHTDFEDDMNEGIDYTDDMIHVGEPEEEEQDEMQPPSIPNSPDTVDRMILELLDDPSHATGEAAPFPE